MARRELIVALSMIVAASPVSAAQPGPTLQAGAPAADANARYCLRIEPITGTRIEAIRCETREDWARLEINVDDEWAKEGVRIIPSKPSDI